MARLVKNKTGDETFVKLLEMLLVHNKKIKTIASDNGVEFARLGYSKRVECSIFLDDTFQVINVELMSITMKCYGDNFLKEQILV